MLQESGSPTPATNPSGTTRDAVSLTDVESTDEDEVHALVDEHSPSLFFEHPDWLVDAQRGVEISEDFHYARLITGWQVMMDLPAAGAIPEGYGHLYTKQANAEAWIAVTLPEESGGHAGLPGLAAGAHPLRSHQAAVITGMRASRRVA